MSAEKVERGSLSVFLSGERRPRFLGVIFPMSMFVVFAIWCLVSKNPGRKETHIDAHEKKSRRGATLYHFGYIHPYNKSG